MTPSAPGLRLILHLALRDLARGRVHLICNVAVIASVLVPLLVLYGLRNGVTETLVGRLLANPATLQIDTAGNGAFTPADLAVVQGWPETAFATLKTRSLFDLVTLRAEAGGPLREGVLSPSGAGDPTLPPGQGLAADEVALSAALAAALAVAPGDRVLLVSQAPDRPRQLVLTRTVAAVVPADRLEGRGVLADLGTLDLFEAYYDGFALPAHGIDAGRALETRVAAWAGMRAYARDLASLAPLQARIEATFGTATRADTRAVASVLSLSRNLTVALALTVAVAALGLAATLGFGFWAEVARKRRMLAQLALIGLPPGQIAAIPLVQALVTAGLALAVSFAGLAVAARIAQGLFDTGIEGARIVAVSSGDGALIAAAVVLFVLGTALAAAVAAGRSDPAQVLREAG
jgi:putative ABC transport system permease protein